MNYTTDMLDEFIGSGLYLLLSHKLKPLVFLHKIFVEEGYSEISEGDLAQRWESFCQVYLKMDQMNHALKDIRSWMEAPYLWLQGNAHNDGVCYCMITSVVDQAFLVFESSGNMDSVYSSMAAESNYSHMVSTVFELSRLTDRNRKRSINYCESQIKLFTKELERLLAGGDVNTLDKSGFLKKMQFIINVLRQSPGDFRTLSEQYRKLYLSIRDKIAVETPVPGSLLKYWLDECDRIDHTIEGEIYLSFIHTTFDSKNDEIFNALRLLEKNPFFTEDIFPQRPTVLFNQLRQTISSVNQEVSKIISSLRDYFSSDNVEKDKFARDMIQSCLFILEKYKDDKHLPGMYIEDRGLSVSCPLSVNPVFELKNRRKGISVRTSHSFAPPSPPALKLDELVDYEKLRRNLVVILKDRDSVLLSEIVTVYPPEQGLAEVLGYFSFPDEFSFRELSDTSFAFDFYLKDVQASFQDLTHDFVFERSKVDG